MADLRPFLQTVARSVQPLWVRYRNNEFFDLTKVQRIQRRPNDFRIWLVSGQRLTVTDAAGKAEIERILG